MFAKKGLLIVLGVLIISSFVTAGIGDWFKDILLSPSQPKNVTVSVVGANPVQIIIHNETLVQPYTNPNADSNINLDVIVELIDPNGAQDIDEGSVSINATLSGSLREDSDCAYNGQNTATAKNFTCSIQMWYFDPYGTWTLTAIGNDTGNGTAQIKTATFNYPELLSIEIYQPTGSQELTFPSLTPGATNQGAANDPTIVNNTGNSDDSLQVVGIHLYPIIGQPVQTAIFGIGNFSVDETGGNECTSGNTLINGTAVGITPLNVGNLSAGQGQTNIYYCITLVPANLPAQTYSTQQGGSWTVGLGLP